MTDIKPWSGTDFNGFSAWRGEKKAHDSQTAAWKGMKTELRTRDWEKQNRETQREVIYIDVMSLRAWSSSSLMALYLSFWAYNSSGGQRSTGSSSRCQEQREHKKQEEKQEAGGGEEGREEGEDKHWWGFWRIVLITERQISGLVCGSPVGFERGRLSDSPVNLNQLCTEHCRLINMWVRVSHLQRGSHGFRCSFGKQTTCVCLPDFG